MRSVEKAARLTVQGLAYFTWCLAFALLSTASLRGGTHGRSSGSTNEAERLVSDDFGQGSKPCDKVSAFLELSVHHLGQVSHGRRASCFATWSNFAQPMLSPDHLVGAADHGQKDPTTRSIHIEADRLVALLNRLLRLRYATNHPQGTCRRT